LAETLVKEGYPRPELIESSGGAFEVRKEGVLLFSKLKAGRFPKDEEVVDLIRDRL
jgi:selT/selW/selH-like putative selenoprotein